MKYIIVLASAFLFLGCSRSAAPVANSNLPDRPMRSSQMQNTIAHTTENQTPTPSNSTAGLGKWSQSGDPIDTTALDNAIAAAEKEMKVKSDDASTKALAEAYFERGVVLTEARQYASALGDYRRVLKLDPDHAESKKWIEQIIGIYSMLKKEAPKEGEEPPPLKVKT